MWNGRGNRYCALVLGCIVILSSVNSAVHASPLFEWTPSSVTQTIAIGERKTVTVTFKTSENASNVAVQVVPALQPFIQASPSSFPTISKNSTSLINLTISAGPKSKLGTYQGTIQLVLKGTLAKPLPVNIVVVAAVSAKDQILALERAGLIPTLDRSSDLMGPDTNFNGIRDDVDTHIASLPLTPDQKKSVEQLAKAQQAAVLLNAADNNAVTLVRINIHRAIECLHLRFESSRDTSWLLTRIRGITANTKLRFFQYLKYDKALSGSVSPALPEGNVCDN